MTGFFSEKIFLLFDLGDVDISLYLTLRIQIQCVAVLSTVGE